MTMHRVEFEYNLPEWGSMEFDVDETLDYLEKEDAAIREINETFDNVADLKVTKIEAL